MGVKISNLPAIVTPAMSDIFPVVQGGVTFKESMTQLSSLFATAGANSNITSLIGLTGVIEAPTFINDSNSNPILGFSGTANPVNYVEVHNNDTGLPVSLSAAGSDTNIQFDIFSKGTGAVAIVSEGTTAQFKMFSGAIPYHITEWNLPTTVLTRVVTLPDYTGTFYLTTKANGTEAANAVTASGTTGVITTSALTTAAGASYAITWTNTFIAAASTILLSLMGGTNTKDTLQIKATAGVGTSTLTITNNNAASLDGTVIIGYSVIS